MGPDAFGLGIGAIGSQFADAAPRMGELIAAAGVVAYEPTEGGAVPDYLIGTTEEPAPAVIGSGLLCEGTFETLSRFTKRPGGPAGAAVGTGARVPRSLVVSHGGRGDAGGGGGAGGCAAPALAGRPGAPGALHDAGGARRVQRHAGAGARGHGGRGDGRGVAAARPAPGPAAPPGGRVERPAGTLSRRRLRVPPGAAPHGGASPAHDQVLLAAAAPVGDAPAARRSRCRRRGRECVPAGHLLGVADLGDRGGMREPPHRRPFDGAGALAARPRRLHLVSGARHLRPDGGWLLRVRRGHRRGAAHARDGVVLGLGGGIHRGHGGRRGVGNDPSPARA